MANEQHLKDLWYLVKQGHPVLSAGKTLSVSSHRRLASLNWEQGRLFINGSTVQLSKTENKQARVMLTTGLVNSGNPL